MKRGCYRAKGRNPHLLCHPDLFFGRSRRIFFGYDLVIVPRAQLSETKYFAVQQGNPAHGLVIPSASLGCVPGPFLGMFRCDAVGQRKTLVLAAPTLDRV